VPVAVATPPVIVQDVGINTAGFSPADDKGTEVCTGIVIEGPTDTATALDVTAGVAGGIAGGIAGALADADAEGDVDGVTATGVATAGGEVTAAGEALRLPACLPTKNAPTQIPTTPTKPRIDSVRLLAGVIELT
jgi:hypothetical protein